jgi:hypothetical protein
MAAEWATFCGGGRLEEGLGAGRFSGRRGIADERPDLLTKSLKIERLREVGFRLPPGGRLGIEDVAVGGEHEHLQGRPLLAGTHDQFVPNHRRHQVVGNQQVELIEVVGDGQGLEPVMRHGQAITGERTGQQLKDGTVVIHEQDAFRGRLPREVGRQPRHRP